MLTEIELKSLSKQIDIYFGLSILILGVFGGILNVIIFTTLKTFRETTSAFYLTVVSLVNIGQLLTGLLIRVLNEGFSTDIKQILFICKIQMYMIQWCALVSLTSICLATIDQFLSMTKYRYVYNLRLAQRFTIIICIIWSIYSIFTLVYWNTSSGTCTTVNSNVGIYMSHFHFPVLLGFLPISIMIIFSLLAFYSARTLISRQVNIVRLSRDRQLTAMTLVHVVFVVITTLPYIIYFIYSQNIYTKDPVEIARKNLIYTITVLIEYSSFAGSFYIYCCVSERFRKQLGKVCIDQWRQCISKWNNNQIVPIIEVIGDGPPTRTRKVSLELVSVN